MAFSSISFIFYFIPAVVLLYYIIPEKYKIYMLCFASFVFYTWAVGYFVFVFLTVAAVCWVAALNVKREAPDWQNFALTTTAICFTFGVLAWFKYANFFVAQYNLAAGALSLAPISWQLVLLPAGISFFTFHAVSYVVDVSRGTIQPFSNPIHFLFYLLFFPHLVAGPIVRFHEIAEQIRSPKTEPGNFSTGASLLMWGLIKKVLVADSVAVLANAVFSADPASLTSADVALGTAAYAVQLYFDFSGYSTMAIGMALMFGFKFPQNFRRPYSAHSITEFWRRWHMTLSNWFRDYVYIPLGGNRGGSFFTYRNLMIVFLATGLWHGANWTFILWGFWHGFWIVIERVLNLREAAGWFVPLRRFTTLLIVLLGWILFRADNVEQAAAMYSALTQMSWAVSVPIADTLTPWCLFMLLIGLSTVFLPRSFDGHAFLFGREGEVSRPLQVAVSVAVTFIGFPLALLAVVSSTYSAFLYFQF